LMKMVGSDPGAVGFISYADFEHAAAEQRALVKILTINGVHMQRGTILSGRYPLTRSMFFAVQEKQTPATSAFIAFFRSQRGRQITIEQDLVPVF